ncbi:hypothetical protein TYRP_008542 [Tyrophagus putrescentiae]|nr:hypothetical protein TYRP_008542 [Tyrophagus putrescentiae]
MEFVKEEEEEEEETEIEIEQASPSSPDALLQEPLPAEEGVWPAAPASPTPSLIAAWDEDLF